VATILDKIIAYKRDEISAAKQREPFSVVEARAKAAGTTRGFLNRLVNHGVNGRPALIAEIKKASPSRGLIRRDFNPATLAEAYERGGALCLSVLTDAPSFQGHQEHLIAAREACALPVLRKDFIIDPYQAAQSRSLGADCILLIMACLEYGQAMELTAAAQAYGMDVLVEVHNEAELGRALDLPVKLIGVNNRDLHSFETSLEVTERLAKLLPDDRLLVSESGIFTPADIARLRQAGAKAFLVGESLMRQADVTLATRLLLQPAGRDAAAAGNAAGVAAG
jgi:indole-3-glycerol phosphate synthase